MYLIIVMTIYHLLKIVFKKEPLDKTTPVSGTAHDDSRHPAEIQLR